MSSTGKAVATGALSALLVLALAAGGGYVYLRATDSLSKRTDTATVALVIASRGEDGATVASLVGLVASSDATTTITDVDPDTRVTIAGTSYDRLKDAYAFGGGAAVAKALPALASAPTPAAPAPAYVAVPEAVWRSALDRGGEPGVRVTLPQALDVFDGRTLTSLPAGEQTLRSDEVAALLRALAYVPAAERSGVRTALIRGIASALATQGAPVSQLSSDLKQETLRIWLSGPLLKLSGR